MNHCRWILVSTAILGVSMAFYLSQPREPEFDGKRLSVWLESFDYESEELVNVAIPALRQMGTNAVGPLTRLLKAKDSCLKEKFVLLLQKQSLVTFHFTPAHVLRARAILACEKLGPAADGAVPALIDLLAEDNQRTSAAVIVALTEIGSEDVVERLVQTLGSGGTSASRISAARALGALGQKAELAVPALLRAAEGNDQELRREARKALVSVSGKLVSAKS